MDQQNEWVAEHAQEFTQSINKNRNEIAMHDP